MLEWWRGKTEMFPIVSLMAKQILATPASTVAVEQIFSAGGLILDDRRSNLTPAALEMQALVDDWTRAQYRAQERLRTNDIHTSVTLETSYSGIENSASASTMSSTTVTNATSDEEENDYVVYF